MLESWYHKYFSKSRSFFLFGSNCEVLDNKGLNFIKIDFTFQRWTVSRIVEHWWLWINDKVNFTILIVSAYISGVDFRDVSFTVIKLRFSFSFHKSLSASCLWNPFSIWITDPHTQIDDVGVTNCLTVKCCQLDSKWYVTLLVYNWGNLIDQT